jgi:chromosome segregation protein
MKIDKLRLMGFKSFVEPTDLLIHRGLTGVVGPNGCGKSNLLEALRWVMGESSYKSMRASAMDDVIFSGTQSRPARNAAEVAITIDNSERIAPAQFNDGDVIEVTRRIERDSGSSYRINGREARARDIKILFEDAATGARSPALVRQGQIGEIVNAKPEQRRRVLEDAAGIAGLHSRRHEAELRLKAAENNLARLGDIIEQLKSQRDGLKRQARQARRYSELTDQIQQAEAVVLFLAWQRAQAEVTSEETALEAALGALGAVTQQEAAAIRAEAECSEKLTPLREQETIRAAVVTAKRHELDGLTQEQARLAQRQKELENQGKRLAEDQVREQALAVEDGERAERLAHERTELTAANASETGREGEIGRDLEAASAELARLEARESDLQKTLSDRLGAERSLKALSEERKAQHARLLVTISRLEREAADVTSRSPAAADIEAAHQARDAAAQQLQALEEEQVETEARLGQTREAVAGAQARREAARISLKSLETERATLAKLLEAADGAFTPVLDDIEVAKGFEVALAAALGDDIEASLDDAAPLSWRRISDGDAVTDDRLPEGVAALSAHVDAPAQLRRRLAQIGLVETDDGDRLQARLKPGQRLVTRAGALWRWDGFVAKADAPSPAAQRLAGRNRLMEVTAELEAVRQSATAAEADAQMAAEEVAASEARHRQIATDIRSTGARLKQAEQRAAELDKHLADTAAKLAHLEEARASAHSEAATLGQLISDSAAEIAAFEPVDVLEKTLRKAREASGAERVKAASLKATLDGLHRERARVEARLKAIDSELDRLTTRRRETETRQQEMAKRMTLLEAELGKLAERPAAIAARLAAVRDEIETAERERKAAADALAEAETARGAQQTALRDLAGRVAEAREARARADARLEAARQRRSDVMKSIDDQMETSPEGCLEIAGIEIEKLPDPAAADTRLNRLKTERERLGGVNLQAEHELTEIEQRYESLERERNDVDEAIGKLRAGIQSLNREGRKRLREAFTTVDGHFQTLFKTLFNGGEARLEMIESEDDPLAGGLEIIARPPGKKPATLSLLSGGEQTLTALSLIFAVFLTNPSPICVLDEVDAPLDDSNVDRFCRMMEKMAEDTDTRFLCITHHPETMARMDRLFGVTMAEKGVSQLVSVDLQTAEQFLEAGE